MPKPKHFDGPARPNDEWGMYQAFNAGQISAEQMHYMLVMTEQERRAFDARKKAEEKQQAKIIATIPAEQVPSWMKK